MADYKIDVVDSKLRRLLTRPKPNNSMTVKRDVIHEISSDESSNDMPLHCVRVPPMLPLVEQSKDLQTHSATSQSSIKTGRISSYSNYLTRKELIVYTKRIDDMDIVLRRYAMSDPKNYLATILAESKPKILGNTIKARERYDKKRLNIKAFQSLKTKIDRLNKCIRNTSEQTPPQDNANRKPKPKMIFRKMETKSKKKTASVLIENLQNVPASEVIMTLIQKAFVFTPQKKITSKSCNAKILNFYKDTQIIFNYENGNEYYRIGRDGEVVQHFRNVPQTFVEAQEDQFIGENIINEKVCCWFRREKFMRSFKIKNMLTNTWKYIKKRHWCPIDNCTCCCESKPSVPIKYYNLKQLTLPVIPNCTTDICNKVTPTKFMFVKHEPTLPQNLHVTTDVSTTKASITESSTIVKQAEDVKSKKVPCSENILIKNIANANNDDKKNCVYDPHEIEKRQSICLKTKVLLEKQLKKLKNISVHITPNAKITAILNVPVSNFSTDELKILCAVLNQAQKEFDQFEKGIYGNVLNNSAINAADSTSTNSKAPKTVSHDNLNSKELYVSQKFNLYATFARLSNTQNETYIKALSSLWKTKLKKESPQVEKEINQELITPVVKTTTTKRGRKRKNGMQQNDIKQTHTELPSVKRKQVKNKGKLKKVQTDPGVFNSESTKEGEATKNKHKSQSSEVNLISVDSEFEPVKPTTVRTPCIKNPPTSPDFAIKESLEDNDNSIDEIVVDDNNTSNAMEMDDEDFILGV